MSLPREWAVFRVEDADNSYLEDVYYNKDEAIFKAELMFKTHPEFEYEVEERRVVFSVKKTD